MLDRPCLTRGGSAEVTKVRRKDGGKRETGPEPRLRVYKKPNAHFKKKIEVACMLGTPEPHPLEAQKESKRAKEMEGLCVCVFVRESVSVDACLCVLRCACLLGVCVC
jgi:hypothetical protein